jgi:hypothetical protein
VVGLDDPTALNAFRRIDAVPEPAGLGALAGGAALLGDRRRRRRPV